MKGFFSSIKFVLIILVGVVVSSGCSPTKPQVAYQSENAFSLTYEAYGMRPTITAEARDIAARHCAKYGKNAFYKGGRPLSMVSTSEIHDFTCEINKNELSGSVDVIVK
jgi:hypothetical protein